MNFDSLAYLAFLASVYVLYRALTLHGQNLGLLVASLLFYGCWDSRFLLLILSSTALHFCAGLLIDRGRITRQEAARVGLFLAICAPLSALVDWRQLICGRLVLITTAAWPLAIFCLAVALGGAACLWLPKVCKARRRLISLVASLSGSLGILAFFKYADFMVGSAGDLINVMGGHAVEWHLDIVLPVGISFYTFQTMGYTIDVYRGKLSASDRIVPFALFVAYFPQLVAGPIERATHLLPILSRARSVSWSQSVEGVYLIVFGLFKKVAIANGVAPAVNSVYSGSSNSSAIDIAMATVLFAIQILCDFSGYSDIARGTSRILGIELMRNFRVPYMARNPGDFWRRWHISLSSWFRDYLYIPLGGNRGGALSTYRNLAITMVLAGLWHGAAWNFLLWGAFHGALLCLHRLMFGSSNETSSGLLSHGLAAIGFFFLACYGWLLFRAESLSQIVEFTTALATGAGSLSHQISMPKLAAVLGIPLLVAVEVMDYRQGIRSVYLRASPMQRGLFLATTLFVLLVGTGNAPQQFIYFQF